MEAVPRLSICLVGIPHWGWQPRLGDGKWGKFTAWKIAVRQGSLSFFLLMVLGKLTKSGSCAATEHLSGGDSPLGMLGLSRRRKGRDTGGRNCSIAGTVLCFFYWNSNSMLLASNNRMALSDCRWILIFLISSENVCIHGLCQFLMRWL